MAPGAVGEELRIIPARAGFTAFPSRERPRGADHPRSRGVYAAADLGIQPQLGSSPLARGLPERVQAAADLGRIIPARAGFTAGSHPPPPTRADHPRSRGVYATGGQFKDEPPGSSPLARGLLEVSSSLIGALRIIPARAGFTPTCPCVGTRRRDHPRSRGVYSPDYAASIFISGSSPLARGLPLSLPACADCLRIIPARAGFTRRGMAHADQ